jgi:HAE1 family hydrophobic/amphiphilic exporter-1
MTIAISGERSIRELTELADKMVKVGVERSVGVGEVRINGGLLRAINVWVDADRLAAYRIPITQVRNALVRQNADVPGGNVDAGARELVLRTMGRVVNPRDFDEMVIANVGGAPIKVRDIGYSEDGTEGDAHPLAPQWAAGGDARDHPPVRVEHGRRHRRCQEEPRHGSGAQLPPDVRMEVIVDQSLYIKNALSEINVHLVLGSILACLVVFVFMRSWRSTIIAGIAIPASVISTFGMMRALDFTLNSVTMLALVLMVGVVIDDAIVVLENIFRFIEEKKMDPMQAAKEATQEIGLAVMATTFLAGRHLSAGLVYVVDLRAISLPVWNHGGGRDPGQSARLLYPDTDDERANAGGRRRKGPRSPRRRFARWFLWPARPCLHCNAPLRAPPSRSLS